MNETLHESPQPSAQAPEQQRPDAPAGMLTGATVALGAAAVQRKLTRRLIQRRGGDAQDSAQVHQAAAQGLSGSPQTLPHLDRIQASFGHHDVSGVAAHVGGPATAASERMGAQAYASGDSVAFAATPDLHTAAHEAAHAVQQRGGVQLKDGVGQVGDPYERHADAVADRVVRGESAQGLLDEMGGARAPGGAVQQRATAVQLLVRDTFPWNGIIANTWSAALRSSPKKDPADPHAGTLADLPKGTRVRVTGRSSNWLNVEVELGGKSLTGYVSQELVDDAVASQMQDLVGQEAAWKPSGPGSGNTFETWASAPTEGAAPALGPGTTINCWEMILYAAYKTGAIDWKWIHDLYVKHPMGTWVSRMTSGGTRAYDPATSKLNRGDLVFFDGLAHVALATGSKDQIYTFWPPPNTPFSSGGGGTVDKVKTSTIKVLSDWMTKDSGGTAPTVTFGAPAW